MADDADNSDRAARTIGRPFPPGVSGNPGGAPKIIRDVAAAARAHTEAAIKVLADAIAAKDAPWSAKIRAAEILMNRGYGHAPQTINLAGNVSTMSHEQLERAIAAQLADYLAGRPAPGIGGADAGKVSPVVTIGPDGLVH